MSTRRRAANAAVTKKHTHKDTVIKNNVGFLFRRAGPASRGVRDSGVSH